MVFHSIVCLDMRHAVSRWQIKGINLYLLSNAFFILIEILLFCAHDRHRKGVTNRIKKYNNDPRGLVISRQAAVLFISKDSMNVNPHV